MLGCSIRSSFPHCRFYSSSSFAKVIASNRYESLGAKLFYLDNPSDAPNVIAKWKEAGRVVSPDAITSEIRQLINRRTYGRACEIWSVLAKKKIIHLKPQDYASYLDCIANHRGLRRAELYFERIPEGIKDETIYTALLNIYIKERETAKAEAVMEKMAGGGFLTSVEPYILMMSLYMLKGKNNKADEMFKEVKDHIEPEIDIYNMWLKACVSMYNVEAADMVFSEMKEAKVEPNWLTYENLASLYVRKKMFDKASAALIEMEFLLARIPKNSRSSYYRLMAMHGEMGNKDEVLRIWEDMKLKFLNIIDHDYHNVIHDLLKANSIQDAENIYLEWSFLIKERGLIPKIHQRTYILLKRAKEGKFEWDSW